MSLKAIFTDSTGNQKTVKIPWYAALAGASPTRPPKRDPKIKPCNSCKGQGKCSGCGGKGKVGGGGGGGGKDNNQQKSGGGGGGGGGGDGNKGFSSSDQETYTAADDKVIIEMKTAGKTWKEILVAIERRSESQLKNHWKNDLQAQAEGGGGGGNDGNKGDEKKCDGKGGQQQQQGKGGAKGKKGGLDEQMAKELEKQESRKWENMASRHFDKTGERISADEAKKRYAK